MEQIIKKMEEKNFEAYLVDKKEDVYEVLLKLIDKDDLISSGGSVTLKELDILNKLKSDGFKVNDRSDAKTPEEVKESMLKAFTSDVYLTSANAISKDGDLVNIDGTGNRVAAICYGPKSVIFIVGQNKIADNLEEARFRARNVAAPLNTKRLDKNTPCKLQGRCYDCKSNDRICASFVETRFSKPARRIKVILVKEDLGY